jgi:phospholipase/carboxylesterase
MPSLDVLAHAIRPAAGEPAGALVLLHGRGTSERDLYGLLDVFDPRRRLVGACPRGPLSLPPGGSHWYVVPRVGFPHPETFRASYDALGEWLAALAEDTGIPPERTILGGFSQGCVMAWALTLGPGRERPAGMLHMSGFVPTVPGFDLSWPRIQGMPVLVAHGTLDPIIPEEFGDAARERARAAGADVTYRSTAVSHTIDPAVVPDIVRWVGALPAAQSS